MYFRALVTYPGSQSWLGCFFHFSTCFLSLHSWSLKKSPCEVFLLDMLMLHIVLRSNSDLKMAKLHCFWKLGRKQISSEPISDSEVTGLILGLKAPDVKRINALFQDRFGSQRLNVKPCKKKSKIKTIESSTQN